MPAGMGIQGGDFLDPIEIPPMPVQIAGDHHLVGQFRRKHDQIPHPAGGGHIGLRGLLKRGDDVFDILIRSDHFSEFTVYRPIVLSS